MKNFLFTAILLAAGFVIGRTIADDMLRTERDRVSACYQKYADAGFRKDFLTLTCVEKLEE